MPTKKQGRTDIWKVLGGTALIIILLASERFGLSPGNSATIAAMGMLLLPWVLSPKDPSPSFHFNLRKDLWPLLKWAMILIPVFLVGYHFWHNLILGQDRQPEFTSERLAFFDLNLVLVQVIAIALPEEYFFRGFVQPTLNRHMGRIKIAGLNLHISWAIIAASALFALVHLVVIPAPFRLAVFFPGIIFGLLYERSKSLTPSILFHAGSNLFLALCNNIWGISG
jgi:membrane protease YdiL (CAAX protease family)